MNLSSLRIRTAVRAGNGQAPSTNPKGGGTRIVVGTSPLQSGGTLIVVGTSPQQDGSTGIVVGT